MSAGAASPDHFHSFGGLLRYLRRRSGLTQDELGRAVGYGREQIVRFEKDQRKPDIDVVRLRFLDVLGLRDTGELAARLVSLAAPVKIEAMPELMPGRRLPVPATRLFGREQDVSGIVALFDTGARLQTLTGAGGVGKTRLALQVAGRLDELQHDCRQDGVVWVELAPVSDAAQVADALLHALGAPTQTRAAIERAQAVLADRRILIVLDNCEHLIDACAQLVAELLAACRELRILATSREALGIQGETIYRVPSLGLPTAQAATLPDIINRFPSVRLFLDRAAAVKPGFEVSLANAPSIASICRQLDGIPLAIELAATRVASLSTEQIAGRLSDSFSLLNTGNRAALPRQRTLRAAMDWSYDLLSVEEQRALQWLSVFAGGWSCDAAEALLAQPPPAASVLETLTALVNKSLVMADDTPLGTRYRMLETVRQYALQKLAESQEHGSARQAHARYFMRLAEQADPLLRTDQQLHWYACLDMEQTNFRVALGHAVEQRDSETGQRLFSGLFFYWLRRAHWGEGVRWADLILPLDEGGRSRAHAWTLLGAAFLAARINDVERTQRWAALAMPLGMTLGDDRFLAFASFGYSYLQTDHASAIGMIEQAISFARRAQSPWDVANLTSILGDRLRVAGQLDTAETCFRDSARQFREIRDREGIPYPLGNLGRLMFARGDHEAAQATLAECIILCRQAGFAMGLADWLWQLAWAALRIGDPAQAEARLAEAFEINRRIGNQDALSAIAVVTGELCATQQRWRDVAQLAGSLAKTGRHVWVINMSTDEVLNEMGRFEADARHALGDAGYVEAHSEGGAWPLSLVIERALG